MSEEKHTPGPWHADIRRSYGFPSSLTPNIPINPVVMGSPVNRSLAKVPRLYPEAEANARLIAAAPDLLADLQESAATLRRYETLHRAKGTAESDEKAEVNARLASRFEATIAKATGGAA